MIVEPIFDKIWTVEVGADELAVLQKISNRRNCTIAAVITAMIKAEIEFFENEENGGP